MYRIGIGNDTHRLVEGRPLVLGGVHIAAGRGGDNQQSRDLIETPGRHSEEARRELLSREEIDFFIDGVTRGEIADYQISALLMAIYLNGMNEQEQQALTEAMLQSGNILDFSDIPKPKADKHSTGGVGDKTSLIIAPMLAACGVCVPMIS